MDHFPYDYDLATSTDKGKQRDAQGAYYAIQNGKGICSSLSKLFRSLVEAFPFGENGAIAWNDANAKHLSVTILTNPQHEWTSIEQDGVVYHYDCSVENPHHMHGYRKTAEELLQSENAAMYQLEGEKYD